MASENATEIGGPILRARFLFPLGAMNGGAEGLPDVPVSGWFFGHALRMELQADYEFFFRIVKTLD
jgi:hypothetical protein